MSLNLAEIPTEWMLKELSVRYEHIIVCGAKDISGEQATSLCFANGMTLANLGLAQVMQRWLLEEFNSALGPEVDDIP